MSKSTNRVAAYTGSAGRTDGLDSDSWFTPTKYLEAARAALGTIELDPMSSVEANKRVKAERFFTEEDDAFKHPWNAKTLWMNPPYSRGMVNKSVDYLIEEVENGRTETAIVLVNNATETLWFQKLARHASLVCFTDHRISFWNADGKKSSGNTRGQAFFLIGGTPAMKARFVKEFAQFGYIFKAGRFR